MKSIIKLTMFVAVFLLLTGFAYAETPDITMKIIKIRNPVEITNYLLHIQHQHRIFVDLNNSTIQSYDYFCDSGDQFLRVIINNQIFDFQAETPETRQFIKNFLHIDITKKVGC